MTSALKISVVVPCFNHGEFLADAVASVLSARRGDVELIVVDDGSTDERTHHEMEALCRQGVHVIRQENKGLAAARNAGILASTAPYILPLDADNRVRPAYFEHGIRILDSDPKAGVVYGDAEYIGERSGRWQVGSFDLARLMRSNYIDACAVIRREVWEQNGGYDSAMPVQGAEDWDLWLGTIERGWQFAYVPEILFEYRKVQDSMIVRLRASGRVRELDEYVAKRHGALYRWAWLSAQDEPHTVRLLLRRLAALLKSRMSGKVDGNASQPAAGSGESR